MNQAVVSYEELAKTMAAVDAASGNITKAAIALGMPRSTVSAMDSTVQPCDMFTKREQMDTSTNSCTD